MCFVFCVLFLNSNLPEIPKHFLGRNFEIYYGLRAVLKHKFLNLFGARGIGKSDLSKAIAQYARNRNYFPDGVFFVKLDEASSNAQGMKSKLSEAFNLTVQV